MKKNEFLLTGLISPLNAKLLFFCDCYLVLNVLGSIIGD